jgi:hypothetical protein
MRLVAYYKTVFVRILCRVNSFISVVWSPHDHSHGARLREHCLHQLLRNKVKTLRRRPLGFQNPQLPRLWTITFLYGPVSRISDKTQAAKEGCLACFEGPVQMRNSSVDTKIKRRNASSFRLHYALRIQLYGSSELLCFVFDGLFFAGLAIKHLHCKCHHLRQSRYTNYPSCPSPAS